jgi:cytosine/adenosine deaminase-related metal-dependent hydrolase
MYRFVARLSPDDLEAIAAFAYMEMLEAGFTSVAEFHYLHHRPDGRPYDNVAEMSERIVAAADSAGIGLTLLPVLYRQGGFLGKPPTPGQRRFLNTRESYARVMETKVPGGAVGIAPHSLRAVTLDDLKWAAGTWRGRLPTCTAAIAAWRPRSTSVSPRTRKGRSLSCSTPWRPTPIGV